VRTYLGWQSGTNQPTGPTLLSREDRPGSYSETLTMSATPHVTGGAPDGTEAVSALQTLARTYVTNGGQVNRSDAYFSLAGLTYSTAPYIGTANTNYYSTLDGFDADGRQNRAQAPTGTISRTVYDALGRTASSWIGTNDNGATDSDPTGGGASGNNMVKVSDNAYDTYTTPTAPVLAQTSGGTLPATTYFVKVTYLLNGAETPASPESSLAVSANFLLQVNSPANVAGATGYNVYAATAGGREVLQNGSTPIAIGTNWTEPTTGLVTGTAAPFTNGVGDSNLTQTTQYPGGGATNRVTQNWYDWRDRLVASKSGVQATEDTTTHRPISYTNFDNLSEAWQVQSYDGDTVTLTYSSGVPQAPAASLLRGQTKATYDDQGRAYLSQTYSVNPSTGAVSSNSLNTNTWYNHRSLVIKTSQPGGLVRKNAYDGAGRTTVSYTTDGYGDAAPGQSNNWANAGTVSSTNNVLEQVETGYDADGNAILTTTRQRNHDETTGGPLGNATTTPKARVSYVAGFYDAANRVTATVDVGTNGGTAWTRPATPPAASDTVLVTSTAYNAAGWVDTVTDPRGIQSKTFYDNLGRRTKSVAAYDGGPSPTTPTRPRNSPTTAATTW
jgi:hypothetical protein